MTQEQKQLLLKDLCARLTYRPKGVKLNILFDPKDITIVGYTGRFVETVDDEIEVERVRLYLRPMSSMTDKEKDELYTAMDWYGEIDEAGNVYTKGQEKVYRETFYEYTDWLNEHHFDYRGLIPMGLALEAPEGMYKTE